MKFLDNGKVKTVPLLQVVKYFPKKNNKNVTASRKKLWGLRGKAPNEIRLPLKESLIHCNCNRCGLSLQALPTTQK